MVSLVVGGERRCVTQPSGQHTHTITLVNQLQLRKTFIAKFVQFYKLLKSIISTDKESANEQIKFGTNFQHYWIKQ